MASEPKREYLVVGDVPVLSYVPFRQQVLTADEAMALADREVVLAAVLDQLAGCWFSSSDDALTDALIAAGATVARHSHVMTCDLPADLSAREVAPAEIVPVEIVPIGGPSIELAELSVRAYPADHVDSETTVAAEAQVDIDDLLSGALIGPFLGAASGMVIEHGRPVAVMIVNRMPGAAPTGGPWVSELYRDPDPAYRGLGAALLDRSLRVLGAQGETSLSLAVTEGNAAAGLYRRLGFRTAFTRRKLLLPPG